MAWGISPNASEKEKIKAEMNDFLMGQNSCGKIDYSVYSETYDFAMNLFDKMYDLGKEDDRKSIEKCLDARISNANSTLRGCYDCKEECINTTMDILYNQHSIKQLEDLKRVLKGN